MERIRIIEQYLDGALSDDEKRLLEEQAASDEDLRKQIILHQEINESIRDKDLFTLQRLITRISAEQGGSGNSLSQSGIIRWKKGSAFQIIRMAAMLLIIAGTGFILHHAFFRDNNAPRLFEKYYTVYDADGISRSLGSDQLTLDEAIISFTQQNYTESLDKLNRIVQSDQDNYLAWFFRGLAFLETDATEEAIQSFEVIPLTWDSPYREHRDWYLALAYLRLKDLKAAKERFSRISASKGYYTAKAKEISRKLNP